MSALAPPARTLVLVAILAFVSAGVADAAGTSKVIGRGVLTGKILVAQATAKGPTKLSAKVTASPAQKVRISFRIICSKGLSKTDDDYDPSTTPSSGTFSATAPLTRPLKLPFANPKTCSVAVYSYLTTKNQNATLQILQG